MNKALFFLFCFTSQVYALTLSSPSFEEGQMIPKRYTCQGENINPPLTINDIPENTKSLALIFDDPDAPKGEWVHWVVWNIPSTQNIAESSVPSGAMQGKNGWGDHHYGGPCPPTGTHRYYFRLYALETKLDLPDTTTKQELQKAMGGHILAQTTLLGIYQKDTTHD